MPSHFQWNQTSWQDFDLRLRKEIDPHYREFQKRIIFTQQEILGVRMPVLTKFSKEIKKRDILSFLDLCPTGVYEYSILYGLGLGMILDIDVFLQYLPSFLERMDNWATCDICASRFAIFKKYPEELLPVVRKLTLSQEEYTVRLGVVLLMDDYLDSHWDQVMEMLLAIPHPGYYVKMAVSWLLSVAFTKDFERTFSFFTSHSLNEWIMMKTISKCCDSYRLTKKQKEVLKQYRKKITH